VICDFVEEDWQSMDLVGQMLLDRLQHNHAAEVHPVRLCPPMLRHCSGVPLLGRNRKAHKADCLVNRFWHYPKWLRKRAGDFQLFHVVDHSYSHLLHALPPGRTLVTCHDLEAFRGILSPGKDSASRVRRLMARRILSGFRKAAHVACDSQATKNELLSNGLIEPDRATVIVNGFHPSCSPKPDPAAELAVERLLGPPAGPELLNVGTTVERKGIDFLLQVFAAVRRKIPEVRLIRAGGAFSKAQLSLIGRLGIGSSIVVLPFLDRPVLAAAYRRASLLLQTSSYEGFGLPVVEAMACGTPVVASDIPVFHEVGGDAAVYCPLGDLGAWSRIVAKLIDEHYDAAAWSVRRAASVGRAAGFTWDAYAVRTLNLYEKILNS
jgi:glycosyltransferase involved in cell wall biosynthesis